MNVASAGKGGKSSDKYKARLDGGVVVGRKGTGTGLSIWKLGLSMIRGIVMYTN